MLSNIQNRGGQIDFRVIEEPCEKEGYAWFRVEIQDTGIGMSPDFLKHIYENFSRERNTTESQQVGTGLGMAIVKKFVDLMGGTIEVESELGKGSKFTVRLMHRVADASGGVEKETEKSISIEELGEKRILLAEDNALNAEIAEMLLSEEGFEVHWAEDGAKCVTMLEKAAPHTYDLILMDVQMPVMNGYEATQKIRQMKDPEKANIPIIAMTANAFAEDKKKALEMGMNAHVGKPIDVKVLKQTLLKVLS